MTCESLGEKKLPVRTLVEDDEQWEPWWKTKAGENHGRRRWAVRTMVEDGATGEDWWKCVLWEHWWKSLGLKSPYAFNTEKFYVHNPYVTYIWNKSSDKISMCHQLETNFLTKILKCFILKANLMKEIFKCLLLQSSFLTKISKCLQH